LVAARTWRSTHDRRKRRRLEDSRRGERHQVDDATATFEAWPMLETGRRSNPLGLRATLVAMALAMTGCASTGTFALSGQQLADAESEAQFLEGRALEAEGLSATFLMSHWQDGRCRWSDKPNIAVCAVRYRHYAKGPLLHATVRYERDEGGGWRWLGPVSEKTPAP
jgi:hypothetical protein